jgi:hypothetical protein
LDVAGGSVLRGFPVIGRVFNSGIVDRFVDRRFTNWCKICCIAIGCWCGKIVVVPRVARIMPKDKPNRDISRRTSTDHRDLEPCPEIRVISDSVVLVPTGIERRLISNVIELLGTGW